jgi:hypothetical protein
VCECDGPRTLVHLAPGHDHHQPRANQFAVPPTQRLVGADGARLSNNGRVAHRLRLETMVEAREAVEEQEARCPPSLWSLASYKVSWLGDSILGAVHFD